MGPPLTAAGPSWVSRFCLSEKGPPALSMVLSPTQGILFKNE